MALTDTQIRNAKPGEKTQKLFDGGGRHGRKSTVVVTQLPVTQWHEIIGDATLADAICDRLVHGALRLDLKGGSLRKEYAGK